MMADYTNTVGALPVRNFSAGRIVDPKEETFEAGGDFIYNQNTERGGDPSHACMPGCLIKCSNVYVDKDGNEVVSPLEYETIGLLGTNCGLKDPDDIAHLNFIANDLGIDTIEVGAMLAILMDHGEAEYGDVAFMERAMEDIRVGNERGRILAQGTARVGAHYGIERVPVIKKQAISAYDPRIIEVTGVSMMLTAQGADHTAGNLPAYDCNGKTMTDLAEASYGVQINSRGRRFARPVRVRADGDGRQPQADRRRDQQRLQYRHTAGIHRRDRRRDPEAGEGIQPPGRLHGR